MAFLLLTNRRRKKKETSYTIPLPPFHFYMTTSPPPHPLSLNHTFFSRLLKIPPKAKKKAAFSKSTLSQGCSLYSAPHPIGKWNTVFTPPVLSAFCSYMFSIPLSPLLAIPHETSLWCLFFHDILLALIFFKKRLSLAVSPTLVLPCTGLPEFGNLSHKFLSKS